VVVCKLAKIFPFCALEHRQPSADELSINR
jgi:hypothetical protein